MTDWHCDRVNGYVRQLSACLIYVSLWLKGVFIRHCITSTHVEDKDIGKWRFPDCSLEEAALNGWWGGSVGIASDSRSKDPRFEPRLRQEHKKNVWDFFRVKNTVLTRCRCAQPPCAYRRMRLIMYSTHVKLKDPVVHVTVWWIMETRKTEHALYK